MHGDIHISNIIAVDSGDMGCRVAVAILGRAEGGPANIATGFDLAHQKIMDVIQDAWANLRLDNVDVSTGICVFGFARARIGDHAIRLAKTLRFANTYVTDDRETTSQGALTGDMAIARHGIGESHTHH